MKSKPTILKVAILLSLILVQHILIGQKILNKKKVAEKLADGFEFTEGPVFLKGLGLLFSDIPENKVYLYQQNAKVVEFLKNSGNSNGLAINSKNQLILAQHGLRQVALLDSNQQFITLVNNYKGKRLNSPNDLTLHSDGSVFFTDPTYGIKSEDEELGFCGIYHFASNHQLYLLDSSLNKPNGIALSPDEKKLYVSDSELNNIYSWEIIDDSTIVNKLKLIHMVTGGNADGLKVDHEGNLYCSGPIGIWIFNAEGIPLDTIPVPGQTTNCNWGTTIGDTLYVTSGNAIYQISLK